MAGVSFALVTGEISTTTTARTILQLYASNAGATIQPRVKIREWSVSFKGTSNTAAPIKVDLLFQTTAGTMTSLAPVKWNQSDDEAIQTTGQHSATGTDPTAGDVLFSEEVHPQTGYTWQAPFGGEIIVKGGTRLGLRVTAGADVSAIGRMIGEE